jgi:hypothetical protein
MRHVCFFDEGATVRKERIEEWFEQIEYCLKEALHPESKIPFRSDEVIKVAAERLAGFKTELLNEFDEPDGKRLTKAQRDRLQELCISYKVKFREDDYPLFPLDAFMMPGWAEGWIGGKECVGSTLYVGVSPTGESHS